MLPNYSVTRLPKTLMIAFLVGALGCQDPEKKEGALGNHLVSGPPSRPDPLSKIPPPTHSTRCYHQLQAPLPPPPSMATATKEPTLPCTLCKPWEIYSRRSGITLKEFTENHKKRTESNENAYCNKNVNILKDRNRICRDPQKHV